MSLIRRRGLMIQMASANSPEYSLSNPECITVPATGSRPSYEIYIDYTRTSHVKCKALTSAGSAGIQYDLRNMVSNSDTVTDTWFTIRTGDVCKLIVKNVQNSSGLTWNGNFKDPSAQAITGNPFVLGNATHLSGETINYTATNDINIGFWFLYVANPISAGDILEFDFEFWINGTRIL